MRIIGNSSKLFSMVIIIMLLIGGAGCKSKKKAMEAEAAEKARLEQEAATQRQKEEEERKRREAEEQARRDAERAQAQAPAQKLQLFFNAIANSGNANSANNSINEALTLFASPDTPVLIVISEEGGQKDYDKPTTISNYLNYLKDVKKNPNQIGDLKFDASGKITEMELIKQQ